MDVPLQRAFFSFNFVQSLYVHYTGWNRKTEKAKSIILRTYMTYMRFTCCKYKIRVIKNSFSLTFKAIEYLNEEMSCVIKNGPLMFSE